jgi:hypothetical protein
MAADAHLILAAVLAVVAAGALWQLWWGRLQIPSLADVPPCAAARAPRVSIVIAARNEARHIGSAVRALLAQAYPDFEVCVVDDRSSDDTGPILAGLRAREPRLRVVRIDTLPDGWLGKNHALQRGAEAATGEILLFADGDVILAPDALSRAVRLLQLRRADLLAVAPDLVAPGAPLALVVGYFMMWFLLYLRPWKAADPRSRAFVGIGAFNMVRAEAYRAVGGHARIALRPDDDIMLGKLLKRAGRSQLLATADGAMQVEWYATLAEMARGFRKNAFAGLHYSLPLVAGAVAGNLLLAAWPFVGVWLAEGLPRALYAVAATAQVMAFAMSPLIGKERPWLAPLYPVAAVLFVGILSAAVARTLRRGGIEWRETFYPLARLRGNRI